MFENIFNFLNKDKKENKNDDFKNAEVIEYEIKPELGVIRDTMIYDYESLVCPECKEFSDQNDYKMTEEYFLRKCVFCQHTWKFKRIEKYDTIIKNSKYRTHTNFFEYNMKRSSKK